MTCVGFRANPRAFEGQTPYDLAKQYSRLDVMALLCPVPCCKRGIHQRCLRDGGQISIFHRRYKTAASVRSMLLSVSPGFGQVLVTLKNGQSCRCTLEGDFFDLQIFHLRTQWNQDAEPVSLFSIDV